jgi:comEA protein
MGNTIKHFINLNESRSLTMSFYRTFIAAIAAMGLATAVFAEDTTATTQAPAAEATQAAAPTTADATATVEKVNINKANAKELAKVKGLTVTKAKAIVAFRKKHGDFKSVEDLKEVKGFKKMDEKTMQEIADQLTVG